jgi:molybdate transport system substrate-binding protein
MQSAGVLNAISSKIVHSENVQQALPCAQSGNADAAIVALSLALVVPRARRSRANFTTASIR